MPERWVGENPPVSRPSRRSRRPSASTLVPWSAFALVAAVMCLGIGVWTVATDEPFTPDVVLFPVAYLAFAGVGALILSRQPRNLIGRLAMITGAAGAIFGLCDSLARVREPLPGHEWLAWTATWGFPLSLAAPLLLITFFPSGRLPSPRWRVVPIAILVGSAAVAMGNALTPTMVDHPEVTNPVGIAWFTGSVLEGGGIGWFPLLGGAVAAAIGLVPRLRSAGGIEREQLKWITFAAALHGCSWILLALDLPGVAGEAAAYAMFATLVLIPLATGIAVLRYRLYEIDVVIRRTVLYAAVVAVLAALYVALVLTLQAVLTPLTGGDVLPVAISTLATAASFGPVRRRVREVVDRRFNRSAYDAQRMVDALAERLRSAGDLDGARQTLVTVAVEAVRPDTAGVWLRVDRESARRTSG